MRPSAPSWLYRLILTNSIYNHNLLMIHIPSLTNELEWYELYHLTKSSIQTPNPCVSSRCPRCPSSPPSFFDNSHEFYHLTLTHSNIHTLNPCVRAVPSMSIGASFTVLSHELYHLTYSNIQTMNPCVNSRCRMHPSVPPSLFNISHEFCHLTLTNSNILTPCVSSRCQMRPSAPPLPSALTVRVYTTPCIVL